jgi:16S rRNA (adenine1518-N6/adenine1519-N6)-dimethyltransferase
VSPGCFHPRPEVDSTLLHLVRRAEPHVFPPEHKALIRRCFQRRRKQIGSAIRDIAAGRASQWLELLAAEGFSPTVRAEEIPVTAWIRLSLAPPGPA